MCGSLLPGEGGSVITAETYIRELRHFNRRFVAVMEAFDVGDSQLGSLLVDFGESFDEFVEAVEDETVSA